MVPSLPIETTDHIIDYLHDNRKALLACSLVSPAWRAHAQRHMFHTVNFMERHIKTCLPPVLTAAPHLATHIRALHFPICLVGDGCGAFLTHSPFNRVVDLTLNAEYDCDLTSATIPLVRLGKTFPSVRALTIEEATFDSPATLLSLVDVFPHLSSLYLYGLGTGSGTGSATSTLSALTTLVIEFAMDVGGLLEAIHYLRHLRVICPSHGLERDVGAFAGRLAGSLEELDIQIRIDRWARQSPWDQLETFVTTYTGARLAGSSALRALRLYVSESDDLRGDLLRLVAFVRAISPGDTVHITLGCVNMYTAGPAVRKNQVPWRTVVDEFTRAPFPWKCSIIIEGPSSGPRAPDLRAKLDAMGITITASRW